MVAASPIADTDAFIDRDRLLERIQDRVLWLSMNLVHHANNVRPNPDGARAKVGGHQASSASVVTLMTSLYFDFMRAGDRISVKPHAAPVYHAIQYLLGNLDASYLTMMRQFHGLQAYPSRTKDPDDVDFSTGSVGLGPVAPNFATLVGKYNRSHLFSHAAASRRYISVVGDAELDEGSVWEAVAEPAMHGLPNILWIVDLNRQSLDRVIPGIRVRAWREMFDANGWQVIDAKYGKRLQAKFNEPNGELLRLAIDEMSNEVYQRLLRVPPGQLREWLPRTTRYPKDMARLIGRWHDDELQASFRNLGGHDFAMLREAFDRVDMEAGPSIVFAYTLKGWRLPSVGDPQNHSVVLSNHQMEQLRRELRIDAGAEWDRMPADSAEARLCVDTSRTLGIGRKPRFDPPEMRIPSEFGQRYTGDTATQQTFGLILTAISRNLPEVAERVVTVSPDVASSTNLGGWINRVGVWDESEKPPMPEESIIRALRWEEHARGQHIQLGISENNLFMMLGQLGLSFEADGEMLFPIGTLYDPFVRRGLDAFVYSVYSGAKFIVVGTPSGVSLAPEGGAHQSLITQSIGAEMPELDFYEPCFGQELEWIMLSALERVRRRERSTYLRLTSKRVDQGLMKLPEDPAARERMRRQALGGAYRLVDRSGARGYDPATNAAHIMASGAMVPEAVAASGALLREGVYANVINVTGAGPLYRSFQRGAREAMDGGDARPFLADCIDAESRRAPIVTVVDGHPHSLSWVGSALGARVIPCGVTEFGQSGSRQELYGEYRIDADSIMAACYAALGM